MDLYRTIVILKAFAEESKGVTGNSVKNLKSEYLNVCSDVIVIAELFRSNPHDHRHPDEMRLRNLPLHRFN